MTKRIAMIAAAGRGSRMLSLTENNPKAMLPFNCKPIIGHHLDYLISEKFDEVVIIVGYQKEKLINYVNEFYSSKINIRFAEQRELNGLAGAIQQGLKTLTLDEKDNSTLLILLGDIVLNQTLSGSYDYSFVGNDIVDDWSRWCLMELNDRSEIIKFIDKPEKKPTTNKNVMGVYNINQVLHFEKCINKVIESGVKIRNEFQISQAFELYIGSVITVGLRISKYYDLGELDALNRTRKNIARNFNAIIPTDDNTIIKKSSNLDKIDKEISWYNSWPRKLRHYTPHLVDYYKGQGWYELEFIHSNPLMELYLFNLPEHHEWENIFSTIDRYLEKTREVSVRKSLDDDNKEILIKKTLKRVKDLKKYDFVEGDFITVNNIVYKNPLSHLDTIIELVGNKFCGYTKDYYSYLHGDLFFGNMLYDVNSNVLKLIDPRGEYGKHTIFGDIRYDIAKLNHSVYGYYDFIVNGLYFLEEDNRGFHYHFYESKQSDVQKIFSDRILSKYNEEDIRLLTGILFLTMIPLHSENLNNQKMQFIKAVEFLNEFI